MFFVCSSVQDGTCDSAEQLTGSHVQRN